MVPCTVLPTTACRIWSPLSLSAAVAPTMATATNRALKIETLRIMGADLRQQRPSTLAIPVAACKAAGDARSGPGREEQREAGAAAGRVVDGEAAAMGG